MGKDLLILALAALIPLVVGSAWYSPMLFAKPWMAATGMTPEKAKNSSMVVNMILLYILSFLVAVALLGMVIHQLGFYSMLGAKDAEDALKDPASKMHQIVAPVWSAYKMNFRTYRHGALHGAVAAVFFALPLIASGAIFEQKGWKYILITWGFWFINLVLMGAVICHFFVFELAGM
jgi:hypothetical protein